MPRTPPFILAGGLAVIAGGIALAQTAAPVPPRNPAELAVEQTALANLRPLAKAALQQAVAVRYPYLAPGGDPARVEDYGGDYAVQKLAEAGYYQVPAFKSLCAGPAAAPARPALSAQDAADLDLGRKVRGLVK